MEGERASKECITSSVKHGGGSIMVWGCFGNNNVGDLVLIDGILKKEGYRNILEDHALPCGLRIIDRGFVFQQDNDPKHSSRLCRAFLEYQEKRRKLTIMKWPPQSPDLNPIELLWDELDRNVRKECPTSKKHLWKILQESWRHIHIITLEKLILRMPRLCRAVIKVKGGFFEESKI